MTFVPGLELSRAFFAECVAPALGELAPSLRYAAALIGEGSEVLGYDAAVSTDHDWGPRVLLFVAPKDFRSAARAIIPGLEGRLPGAFKGWPVAFGDSDRPAGIDEQAGAAGSLTHGIELHDLTAWTRRRLGIGPEDPMPPTRWLAVPEQVLLSLTAGAVFRDDDSGVTALRHRLAWFPTDVWLYKLGCQWVRIGEEAAFLGRCGDTGDDLGSRLVAGRLVHDAMRIGFLMTRRYAPYAKWFGRAFRDLDLANGVAGPLAAALAAEDWRDRERFLNTALLRLAEQHLEMGLPGAIAPRLAPYHQRPYEVINAGEIAEAIFREIQDPAVQTLARTGAADQFSDSTAVLAHPQRARDVAFAALGVRTP